jgi:hypothetical protein
VIIALRDWAPAFSDKLPSIFSSQQNMGGSRLGFCGTDNGLFIPL